MRRSVIVGIGLIVIGLAGTANASGGPLDLLKGKLEILRKLAAQSKSHDAIRNDLKKEMNSFFDYKTLGTNVMKGILEKQSAEDQAKYQTFFTQMVQRVYLKRYKPGTTFTNVFGKETLTGTSAVVKTQVKYKRSVAEVVYHLSKHNGSWWVVDVELDDLSLMRSYRKRFRNVVKKSGFAALLQKMQRAAGKK